ncbi:MAG: peptidylprolyl isomerase, partial [Elainellaceae cyanobacterium]
MVALVPLTQFPEGIDPQVGQTLQLQTPQGALPVQVINVQEEGVTLDGNHPLAGEDLTFELTVVEVA